MWHSNIKKYYRFIILFLMIIIIYMSVRKSFYNLREIYVNSSKEIKYVFIHNPKTGGETIEALLNIKKNHKPVYKLKDEIKGKYSFTFVRHPVNRIVSWYNHLLKHLYFQDLQTNDLNNNSTCFKLLKKGVKIISLKIIFRLLKNK